MKKREQGSLFITLNSLVPLDHSYRKLDQPPPFSELSRTYQSLYSPNGRKEKGGLHLQSPFACNSLS